MEFSSGFSDGISFDGLEMALGMTDKVSLHTSKGLFLVDPLRSLSNAGFMDFGDKKRESCVLVSRDGGQVCHAKCSYRDQSAQLSSITIDGKLCTTGAVSINGGGSGFVRNGSGC